MYFGYLGRPKSSSMFVYLLILQGKTGKTKILKIKKIKKVTKIRKKRSYENEMSQTLDSKNLTTILNMKLAL